MLKKLVLLLMALSLFALASCGKDKEEGSKKKVKVVYFESGENKEWFQEMKKEYEAQNPNIEIVLNPLSGSTGDTYSKLALMLQSDNSIDVILEEGFRVRTDVEGEKLADLSEIEKWDQWGNFFEGVKNAGRVNGKLYGVPFATDVRGIMYNKKLFKQAGIETPWQPETWADVNAAAEKLKNSTTAVPLWLYGGMSEGTSIHTFQMLLTGTEDKLLDESDNKWVVKSKGLLDSYAFIDNAVKSGYTAKKSILTNVLGWQTLIGDYIPNDKIGMIIGGNYLTAQFKNYHAGEAEGFKTYGFAKMPKQYGNGFTSVSGGYALTISNQSRHKKEGLDFIKFLVSKDSLVKYFTHSGELSPRKDVAETDSYKTDDIRVAATTFLDFTTFRPSTSDYPAISGAIQKSVTDVELGVKTPKEAMELYAEKVINIVGKENTKENY